MPGVAAIVLVYMMALQADTTVVLGHTERDMTGDGKPEILRVVGTGPTIDDLAVTFTIESGAKTIYRYDMGRWTRTIGYDGSRAVLSAAQHRARLKEFGSIFFDERKFESPAEFVESLQRQARLHVAEIPKVIDGDRDPKDTVAGAVIWQEILNAPIQVFSFNPGGDRVEVIGWNARAGRFYRLLECC